jgi:hypothetical protein
MRWLCIGPSAAAGPTPALSWCMVAWVWRSVFERPLISLQCSLLCALCAYVKSHVPPVHRCRPFPSQGGQRPIWQHLVACFVCLGGFFAVGPDLSTRPLPALLVVRVGCATFVGRLWWLRALSQGPWDCSTGVHCSMSAAPVQGKSPDLMHTTPICVLRAWQCLGSKTWHTCSIRSHGC